MNKFENVDVLASLQQIMQQNTAAFQNDFGIDKKVLTQAAKGKNASFCLVSPPRQMAQPACRDMLICNEVGIYIEFSYTHVLSFRLAKLNDIDL